MSGAAGTTIAVLAGLAAALATSPGTGSTIGMVLSASTFQAGPLPASLPVIDTAEPVSAVLLGTLVFGERLATSPAGLALQLAGAAAAAAGIVLLGRSSPGACAYPRISRAHQPSPGPGRSPHRAAEVTPWRAAGRRWPA